MRASASLPHRSLSQIAVLSTALSSACSSSAGIAVRPFQLVAAPEVVQPSADCPLARVVEIAFDRDVSLVGEATDGIRTIAIDDPPAAIHSVPLVGLYADRAWTVELTAADADGTTLALDPISFSTPPLPDAFPHLDLRAEEIGAMEPGFTLLPITSPLEVAYLVAVDADGEVAWYFDGRGTRFLETVLLPGGHLATLHDNEILELDWEGRIYRHLTADAADDEATMIDARGLDHELSIDAEGHWLTLTQTSRDLLSFPLSYGMRFVKGPASIASDELLVLDPDTGATVDRRSWPDFGDLGRIGYDSLNVLDPGLDWTHANSAMEFPAGDAWLLSARHQDAVVKLDKETGEIRWILGNHDNWSGAFQAALLDPVGAVGWQYHQHAAKIAADGHHVLLFDNANHSASPWTTQVNLPPGQVESRVVEFDVDEDAHTVAQDWEFILDPPVSSTAMGDADWLANGDVLATYAYVEWEGHVLNADLGRGITSFRVVEFDPADGHVVWDLDGWAPTSDPRPNWQTYRALRFSGFDRPTSDGVARIRTQGRAVR